MITLDLNHFGFRGGGPERGRRGGEEESKGEVKRGYSRSRANLLSEMMVNSVIGMWRRKTK